MFKLSIAALFVVMVSGCALMPDKVLPPEEVVAVRAQAYMDAVIAKDDKRAYAMLAPAYRARYSYAAYLGRPQIAAYIKAEVASVSCDSPMKCIAEIRATYSGLRGVRGASKSPVSTVFPDRWVVVDGVWYRYPTN